MFKKLNTKTLFITFGLLLAIVVITQLWKNKQGDSNFKSELFTIDTAQVSSITIVPKGSKDEVKLVKSGNTWSLQTTGRTYKADQSIPRGMLAELLSIRADQIAGTEKSEWPQFELSDTSSTWVRVEEKGKVTGDFRIGKFSFKQPNTMTTYIRLANDENVYAISGFLAMSFNRTLNDLRDKTFVDVNAGNITKVSFLYPADSSFVLTREKNTWKVNGEPADSARTAEFIRTLSHLTSYAFVNKAALSEKPVFTINIEGNSFRTIQLKAFETDTTVKYIATSTLNPEALFDAKSGELMSRAFVGKSRFRKTSK